MVIKQTDLANQFENVFQRLLTREKLNLYDEDMSLMFETIAANLLGELPERKDVYFDGVIDLTSTIRKSSQIEFNGKMWVGNDKTQWTEDFRAIITDKRITKQGILITICVGSDKAEGSLLSAFNQIN